MSSRNPYPAGRNRSATLAVAVLVLVAGCGGDPTGPTTSAPVTSDGGTTDDASGNGKVAPTTIAVADLGAFEIAELDALGIVTTRIVEWVVIGDGRYVAFTQPGGADRGARVRVLDRSRARVRTVDAELGSVGGLHPAGGDRGVVYLAQTDGSRSISYAAVDSEPVALVSVRAGTTRIDNLAVDPTQRRVVWRELRQGRVQVLLSSDLDGGAVVLDETMEGGMLGEGTEDPIVLTDEGTVEYIADRDGDGELSRYEVPIDGGEPKQVAGSE